MSINYNPLFRKLIELNIGRTELRLRCRISPNTMARISRHLPVNIDVLDRICNELDCELNEVVELKIDKNKADD